MAVESQDNKVGKRKITIKEVWVDEKIVEGLAQYGIATEEVFSEIVERSLRKELRRQHERKCPKCGKPSVHNDGYHLSHLNVLKAGSVEAAGYCVCKGGD